MKLGESVQHNLQHSRLISFFFALLIIEIFVSSVFHLFRVFCPFDTYFMFIKLLHILQPFHYLIVARRTLHPSYCYTHLTINKEGKKRLSNFPAVDKEAKRSDRSRSVSGMFDKKRDNYLIMLFLDLFPPKLLISGTSRRA